MESNMVVSYRIGEEKDVVSRKRKERTNIWSPAKVNAFRVND